MDQRVDLPADRRFVLGGVLYDFWTLNDQVSIRNAQNRAPQ
jgi:hypothetical protein